MYSDTILFVLLSCLAGVRNPRCILCLTQMSEKTALRVLQFAEFPSRSTRLRLT